MAYAPTARLLLVLAATSACGGLASKSGAGGGRAPDGGGAQGGDPSLEPVPVEVVEPSCAVHLSGNAWRHCAVYQDGSVWCWGPDGATSGSAGSATPVNVEGLSGAARVFVGPAHSCATTEQGLRCWGNNDASQIDDSGTSPREPTSVRLNTVGLPAATTSVGLGERETCIADSIGHVYCRGADGAGTPRGPEQIGALGSARNKALTGSLPMFIEGGVVYILDDWSAPSSLPSYGADNEFVRPGSPSCAIKVDGSLWCDAYSLVETGELTRHEPLGEKAVWVGSGDFFVCALTDSGRVWCDGWNNTGQLGRGTRDSSSELLSGDFVAGLADVRALSVARFSACALSADGKVSCWGAYGPPGGANAPVQVSGCVEQRVVPTRGTQ